MLRLALRYQGQVRYFPVPNRKVQLGAAAENDLVAPFPGISRHHARLRRAAGGVLVTDLGSTNGLMRDGRRLGEVLLTPGHAVGLGHAVLTLEELSSADGEMGLRLSPAGGSGAPAPSDAETAGLLPEPPRSSPAAALRFVRQLERSSHAAPAALAAPAAPGARPQASAGLLGGARDALGAAGLSIVRLEAAAAAIAAIVDCDGLLPSSALLEEVVAAAIAGNAREEALLAAGGQVALVAGGGGGALLVALLDRPPDPWQRDFFGYLAEKLLTPPPLPSLETAVTPQKMLRFPAGMVVGPSAAIEDLLAQLRATVTSDLNVLLTGETGTGKEMFARLIHASGPHGSGPFIAINCAAIPSELLEAELFGVTGRIATGVDPRSGLFVQAHGGTLFLDEIGDMPERLQAKLLRVLQEREVVPLGGAAPRKIDVRVISASNRDLGRRMGEGSFRADLYYRLRGLGLELPPLRERREDLPPLIFALASRAAVKYGKCVNGISRRALSILLEHAWPGNVRELANELERAVLLCPDGGMLRREHFRLGGCGESGPPAGGPLAAPAVESAPAGDARNLQQRLEEVERAAVLEALALAKGNKAAAARRLGITRNGLALKIRRLGIPP